MRLTEAGHLLVRRAELIEVQALEAERELDELRGLRAGRVRIGAYPTAFVDLLPGAVAELGREHPGLEVELRQVEWAEGLDGLRASVLDVVVVCRDPHAGVAWPAGVAQTLLLEDPMKVVLPRGHRLATRSAVPLEELAEDPWILGSHPDGFTVRAARSAGFEPRRAHTTDDMLAVLGFVAAGLGVAFGPGLTSSADRDDLVVREVVVAGRSLRRSVFAVSRRSASPGAARTVTALGASARRMEQSSSEPHAIVR